MKTLAKAPLAALQVICSLPAPTYGQAGEDPLSPQGLSAQDPRFQHLTTEDGLSDSRVWGVTHDRWGFMWFATFDGLSRCDGYEFKVYRRDPDDPNSPPATPFKLIYEDSAGLLWSATWGQGLVRYNPETEQFVHYQHGPTDSNSVSSSRVRSLYEGSSGTLWIGTQTNGLNCLDRENRHLPLASRWHTGAPFGLDSRGGFTVSENLPCLLNNTHERDYRNGGMI